MKTCLGTTKDGNRCKLPPLTGKEYCHHHLPDKTNEEANKKTSKTLRTFIFKTFGSTSFQIICTCFVFISTMLLTRQGNYIAELIDIPINIGIEFFSLVAQALTALIGFLFVFIGLAIQFIGLERSKWSDLLREKTEKLNRLARECPTELHKAPEILFAISNFLEDVSTQDFIVENEEYERDFIPLVTRLSELDEPHDLSLQNRFYLREVFSILISIEGIYFKMHVAHIGSIVMPVDYVIYSKLLLLLFISIVLVPIFGGVDLLDVFPDLHLPILFSFLTILFLLLMETYLVITRIFESLNEWK